MAKNPYRRLLEAASVSQKDFIQRSGISKSALVLVLNGQLSPLSVRLNSALARVVVTEGGIDAKQILRDEYGTDKLTSAYETWRRRDRANIDVQWPDIHYAAECDEVTSPLFWFIKESFGTVGKFCQALHIHPELTQRYVIGKGTSGREDLQEALEGAGFDSDVLITEQDRWIEARDA